MKDIKKVLGIILYMGIFKMYWQNCIQIISIAAACHSTTSITFLAFNKNILIPDRGTPAYNKCYKILPIIFYTPE